MKHITLWFFVTMVLFGCKKIDKLTHFYMSYQTVGILDQTTVFGSPFDVLTPEITTLKDSIFSSENTSEDRVSQITIKTLSLRATHPDSIPVDYFQSIEIYIIDIEEDDKLIAWNDQIDNHFNPFILTLTSDDLSKYLTKPTIQYRVHGTLAQQFAIKTELNLKTEYFVNAAIYN